MSRIKLERNGKVIERSQADYDANKERYDFRGFKLVTNTPVKQSKPEKEEPIISMDSFNNKNAKHKEEKKKNKKKVK